MAVLRDWGSVWLLHVPWWRRNRKRACEKLVSCTALPANVRTVLYNTLSIEQLSPLPTCSGLNYDGIEKCRQKWNVGMLLEPRGGFNTAIEDV